MPRENPQSGKDKRNGGQAAPQVPEVAESPMNCRKRGFQAGAAPVEEELNVKKQSLEQADGPISLVMSKVRSSFDRHPVFTVEGYARVNNIYFLFYCDDILLHMHIIMCTLSSTHISAY